MRLPVFDSIRHYVKLSLNAWKGVYDREKMGKKRKKVLTRRGKSDNIRKLSRERWRADLEN